MIFVAIDVETTGLDSSVSAICEIGAVARVGGRIETFNIDVYDPGAYISEEAFKINGFTKERYKNGTWTKEAIVAFVRWISSIGSDEHITAVMHNAPFDVDFLKKAFGRYLPGVNHPILRRVLDTCSVSWSLGVSEFEKPPALAEICKHYGVTNVKPHSALADARATLEVFEYMTQNLRKLDRRKIA